ncbi:hypothetical protein M7784_03190 [Desulfovibrio aminophilus]|nr:hypothetical protein [Desulfovibrio aminophilus]MCM0754250.1 hypothetical protein [Desulfovibrio aminophilus]
MILTEKHIQLLKDIERFSRIKRYHGLLPRKECFMFDDAILESLQENGIVEEGVIFTRCGSNPTGYRIAEHAKEELKKLGVDFSERDWDKVKQEEDVALDQLEKEHLDALVDVYHFSKTSKFGGMAPKDIMDDYDKAVIDYLYDAGYIFQIKVKGKSVKYEKGYVLSDKSMRILKQLGYAM